MDSGIVCLNNWLCLSVEVEITTSRFRVWIHSSSWYGVWNLWLLELGGSLNSYSASQNRLWLTWTFLSDWLKGPLDMHPSSSICSPQVIFYLSVLIEFLMHFGRFAQYFWTWPDLMSSTLSTQGLHFLLWPQLTSHIPGWLILSTSTNFKPRVHIVQKLFSLATALPLSSST